MWFSRRLRCRRIRANNNNRNNNVGQNIVISLRSLILFLRWWNSAMGGILLCTPIIEPCYTLFFYYAHLLIFVFNTDYPVIILKTFLKHLLNTFKWKYKYKKAFMLAITLTYRGRHRWNFVWNSITGVSICITHDSKMRNFRITSRCTIFRQIFEGPCFNYTQLEQTVERMHPLSGALFLFIFYIFCDNDDAGIYLECFYRWFLQPPRKGPDDCVFSFFYYY